MNTPYTTLLLTCSISLSLYSMEQEQPLSSTLTDLTTMQLIDIQHLYNQTYEKLEEITNCCNVASNLLTIIERTNHLKSQGITEDHLVTFAFKQKLPLKNLILNNTDFCYNGPHYISVFFARLKEYNVLLKKNNFTSPTSEQYIAYKNNQKINAAIGVAASFRLHIDSLLLKEKNILNDIPKTVAAQEFHQLIADIYSIQCQEPMTIKQIATLLYGPISEKK